MLAALLLFPLLGFLVNACRFQSPHKKLSGWIASAACFASFFVTLFYFLTYKGQPFHFHLANWMLVGDLKIAFSFTLDSLSLLMALLITGVGSFIHLYSIGYMSKDKGVTKYFAFLNLFVFMMLVLVLADSLPLLFVGWEGVGLCSYLLIGFWFEDFKKVHAGMKAFITNRIGDACFLLGMFLLFKELGTLNFEQINFLISSQDLSGFWNPLGLAALFLFLGATGKSAQAPLYVWLADAMAGPTPVSALIHAATMVTAGIYMMVRLFGLFSAFDALLLLIAWVAAITSLGAALVATRQWDFKKILAYSTISQLGYMFMAVGVQAYPAGMFHLLTHGCFKALLFLSAGSVMHALGGEGDIRQMGNLKKYIPYTFLAYMFGALSLMSLPPFSGFFSKDEILFSLFASKHYGLWFVALVTAACTVFYMCRLTFYVFFGKENFKTKPHESSLIMLIPLFALAFFSLFLGWIGVPHNLSAILPGHPSHWLHQFLTTFSTQNFKGSILLEWLLMLVSVGVSLLVATLSAYYYLKKPSSRTWFWDPFLEKAFYVDILLEKYLYKPFKKVAESCFKDIEQVFLLGGIHFLVKQIDQVRKIFSKLQNGNFQSYALYFAIGLCVCLILVFVK